MTVRLETISPIGNVRPERMKIILEGFHTLEQKKYMIWDALNALEHQLRIPRVGLCDLWVAPIDLQNRPLVLCPDGLPLHHHRIIVDAPYPCAADLYQLR